VFKRLPENIKITGVGKSVEEIGEQVSHSLYIRHIHITPSYLSLYPHRT
jgi:hypothetical protein